MKKQDLNRLFEDELQDMYNSESQIVEAVPKFIRLSSLEELKEALTNHLKETENQVLRIHRIFFVLNIEIREEICTAMQGIIAEGHKLIQGKQKAPSLDAAIISAAQKIEHYEIASYGTLKSFAKHLGFDKEVISLLQKSLEEEVNADKKLTKIAEGSFFSSGVNQEAAETIST